MTTCETCRYFRPLNPLTAYKDKGECKRHAPAIANHVNGWDTKFPIVEKTEWCGDYEDNTREPVGS